MSFLSSYRCNLLFILCVFTLFACAPPAGKIISPPPPKPSYTISGKIITPARFKDGSKGGTISTAEVWADPANKVETKADGSYSLTLEGPGTYQITADYTGTDGNYKASDPRTVELTGKPISLDIPLKYGHTTTVTGNSRTWARIAAAYYPTRGVTITAEVEDVQVGKTTSIITGYSITFSHPGSFRLTGIYGSGRWSGEFETTDERRTITFTIPR